MQLEINDYRKVILYNMLHKRKEELIILLRDNKMSNKYERLSYKANNNEIEEIWKIMEESK